MAQQSARDLSPHFARENLVEFEPRRLHAPHAEAAPARIVAAVLLDSGGCFLPSERARARAAQHGELLSGCRADVHRGWCADADLVWVHETVTAESVARAALSRDRGATVLYDVATSGETLFSRAPSALLRELLQVAHAVTADCRLRAERFAAEHGSDRVVVLPDVVRLPMLH